jgi:hypothetical protein
MPPNFVWKKPNDDNGGWVKGFTWVTPNVKKPFYIMKYLQKGLKNGSLIKFPHGLRLYGVSRSAVSSLPLEVRKRERLSLLPYWFRSNEEAGLVALDARRIVGGVAVGSRLAVSPYSNRPLASPAALEYTMYHAWVGSSNPSA